MALFNYATRELSAKIVYYGPGLSGKTTNIEMIHKLLRPEQKGRLISLPTETDRTLFFDFLPVELGQIKGFKVRFHLYTVPGQVFYNATRRLVLQGVDGVVFVADSQQDMESSNVESLRNLADNLATYGKSLSEIPFVLQYNKRDLRNIMPVERMDAVLNPGRVPVFEAVAVRGEGVTETLVAISRMVFAHLRKTLLPPAEAAAAEEMSDIVTSLGGPEPEAEPLEEIEVEEIVDEAVPEEAAPAEEEIGVPGPAPEERALEEPARSPIDGGPAAEPPEEFEISPPEAAGGASAGARIEELDEIEIVLPEPAPRAEPLLQPRASISVESEGGGLTFLRFDSIFVSPDGHAVLPAVFLDGEGNIVRIRIRVALEEDRG